MRTPVIITLLAVFLLQLRVAGQCDNKLIETAIAQSGADALFVREFKSKLKKGSVKNPVPAAKYNVYLKQSTTYRFNVVGENIASEAILQLFDNGKCVGSTYDEPSRVSKPFDFEPGRTGNFQVVMSYKEGAPGCVAGAMSLIVKENSKMEASKNETDAELETLYVNVENPVSIITDKEPTDTMVVEIDNGRVYEKSGNHYVRPEAEGLATLKVIIKSRSGVIKEEARSDFLVRRLPVPLARINGLHGGIISRSSIQLAENLSLDTPVDYEKYGYRIESFTLKIGLPNEERFHNYGGKFSPSLKSFLTELPEETRLFIEAIHVRKPDGEVITLEPLAFIIR